MKTIIVTVMLVLVIAGANAQNKESYWVVESNSTDKKTIVKIYNTENKLVSEQNVERRIDIRKKKDRRMLNKMVKQSNELLWSKR